MFSEASPHAPPRALSLNQRAEGRRHYYRYAFYNAISYAVLAEGVVVLALLRLGGTEAWVGAVGALVYITLPVMALGYRMLPRLGVARTAGLFWAIRSVSAGLMILAPWALALGEPFALWCMFAGSLGFMLGRAGGMVSFTGIITELTTPRDRGELISNSFKLIQTGGVVTTVLIALFLGSDAPLYRYQLFFALGVVCGLVAAWSLWHIPESGEFRRLPPFRLREELRWAWATPGRRWFLAMMVAVPVTHGAARIFIILIAKQGYGLSDQQTVLYVLVGVLGGILASYTYGVFLDRVGARPLLVLTGLVDMAEVALVWVLPAAVNVWLLALLFAVNGYAHVAFQAATQHYFIALTDRGRQLQQGIVSQAVGGVTAGIALYAAGWMLGGLRPLAAGSGDPLLHFRWFFGGLLVLMLVRTVVFVRLPALDSAGVRDALNALLSPWDWRAIHAVRRAVSRPSEDEESRALTAMLRAGSAIYRDELERYLRSPSLFVRQRALDALALVHPNTTLVDALLEDVRVNVHTTASRAARWLGQWQVRRAVPELLGALDSPDVLLRAAAIHALVELDEREAALERVRAMFAAATHPLLLIEGARALSLWGGREDYPALLEKYHLAIPPQAKDELSLSVARLLGLYAPYYRELGMLRREPAQLWREWEERFAPAGAGSLIAALREGQPRRDDLRTLLAREAPNLQPWFAEATEGFLARRPETLYTEPAFLLIFLLLTPRGRHRVGG